MSTTVTKTYTVSDIERVMRSLRADLIMIADSTGAVTRTEAADYANDFEVLAKDEYLDFVDITLRSLEAEIQAVRYVVNTEAGGLTANRPGGVLWPRVASPHLQVVIGYTEKFKKLTAAEERALRAQLKVSWTPTSVDISHASLQSNSGRSYVSNAYGVTRKDYGS